MAWFEDPEVGRYLALPLDTPELAKRMIRGADNRTVFFFGVFARETNGLIGYTRVDVQQQHRWAKTTSVIGDKDYWGGDYAMEARTAILKFMFRRYGMNKMMSYVYGRNFPAIFNNKALGYTCEGILRRQERGPDGEYRDVLCFGLLRDEWLARQG